MGRYDECYIGKYSPEDYRKEAAKKGKPLKYTKSELKEKGFTEKMIEKLLPEPELACNPFYKCASPMKLYDVETVNKVMESDEFKAMYEKAEKRRMAIKTAMDKKEEELIEQMKKHCDNIHIPTLEEEELRERVLEEKQDWYNFQFEHHNYKYYDEPRNAYTADSETIDRWSVNYLRHNCTNYDYDIYQLKGRIGKEKARILLKNMILDKIAELYPDLQEECICQKE